MSPAELTDLQRSLRDILPDPDTGVLSVLAALKNALPEQTVKYNAVFNLEIRFNAVKKDQTRGLLSSEDLALALNRINADVLDLIDGLRPEDFEAKTAESSVEDKAGSILYRIPHTMEVEEEHKCVVRLAFDVDTVVKNIEITPDTIVKDVRVSEVMEVELLDPSSTPAFAIRRVNSVEQFLEKNDYTEWVFYVKPLVTGEHPLVLKVSVKELINDKERIKEIVLEEVIVVVAEPAPGDESSTFQSSGYTFSYSNAPDAPASTGPSKQKAAMLLILGLVVASGVLAAVGMLTGVIPAPPWLGGKKPGDDDRAFWAKTLQAHDRNSFEAYLNSYPDGLYEEEARFKIDSLKNLDNLPLEKEGIEPLPIFEEKDSTRVDSLPAAPIEPGKNGKGKTTGIPQKTGQTPATPTPDAPKPKTPGQKLKSGFEMVSVPGGSLTIPTGDCPAGTSVQIRTFKIGKYEITQADWSGIMGSAPSFHSQCPECPVERVSWDQVQDFIQKLNKANSGKQYRLPYEAEWEWAARGGLQSKGYKYAGGKDPNSVAWFNIIQDKTHEVGTMRANELGIYDMSGNVWEWCLAPYPPYLNCPPSSSDKKSLRGGSWADNRSDVKISSRRREKAKNTDRRSGFRLVQE